MQIRSAVGAVLAAIAVALPAAAATTYYYDDLGRLWIVGYDNGMQITYGYDAAGNRTQVVTQSGTNLPPTANPDNINVTVNTPLPFYPLTNDTDPNNDSLTITAVGTPLHGTTTNTTTKITYTPQGSYAGTDSFTYTITDGQFYSTATVFVTVIGCAQPPNAVNDAISTKHAVPYTFDPRTNDTDSCGYSLTITQKTNPSHGSVQIVSNGTQLKYTATANYNGSDSFTYTVSDGHGQTAAPATVNATDQGINNNPVALNDSLLTIPAANCPPHTVIPWGQISPMWNDSDPDQDPITISSVTQGANGSVTNNGDGTVTYTYKTTVTTINTTDNFSYTISDGFGGTATAAVAVTIKVDNGC